MPEHYRIVGVSRGRCRTTRCARRRSLSLQMFGPKRVRAADRVNFCHRIFGANHDDVPEVVARAEHEVGGQPAASSTWRSRPRRSRRRPAARAPRACPTRARVIIEKPFGMGPRVRAGAERRPARGLPRAARVPDRPLPRQGVGREHPRAALRERHVRAGLEPRPHRPRPDRRARDALDRGPRRLLRGHRRVPGHGRHAPVPGARLRRHGAADLARRRRRCASRRTRSSRR